MPEITLEALRCQMRESEGRMKRAAEERVQKGSAEPGPFQGNAEPSAGISEFGSPLEEWAAYGQMTPGFLSELSIYLAENIQKVLHRMPVRAESEIAELIQIADRTQSFLSRWIESAGCLAKPKVNIRYPEMIQAALSVRRAEFLRWGIRVELEDATDGVKSCDCTLPLLQAVLHITQYCVEQLQTARGASRLLIRVQNSGERLETSFVWNNDHTQRQLGVENAGRATPGNNIELQAAQKCLNRLGGTLLLENIGDAQRAVRMTVNLAAITMTENLRQAPRS